MKNLWLSLSAAMSLIVSDALQANVMNCVYRRPNVYSCTLCSDTPGVGFAYFQQGQYCWGCNKTCTQITPLVPDPVNDLSTNQTNLCPPGTTDTESIPFYALRLQKDTVRRVAQLSPIAADLLITLREAPVVPPLRVHGGDGVAPSLPTLESALRFFDSPQDERGVEALRTPLPAGQALDIETDIEVLAAGRILLVVNAYVMNDKKEIISSERPFAIELKAIPGVSSRVGGYEDYENKTAQVYEVISFGLRDDY